MIGRGKTLLGFTTQIEWPSGRVDILFALTLTQLREQWDERVPDLMFDSSQAQQVEIRKIADCGKSALPKAV